MNYGTRNERARKSLINTYATGEVAFKSGKKAQRFIDGMTVPEASKKTGIPVQTLYWRIHRGWADSEILRT
jgi:hypothetical protein